MNHLCNVQMLLAQPAVEPSARTILFKKEELFRRTPTYVRTVNASHTIVNKQKTNPEPYHFCFTTLSLWFS